MAISIHFNAVEDQLEIVRSGVLTLQDMLNSISKIENICQQHQCFNIIVDARQAIFQLTESDMFIVIEELAEIFEGRLIYIVIATDDQFSFSIQHLLEKITAIRGIDFHFAEDERDAIQQMNEIKLA